MKSKNIREPLRVHNARVIVKAYSIKNRRSARVALKHAPNVDDRADRNFLVGVCIENGGVVWDKKTA